MSLARFAAGNYPDFCSIKRVRNTSSRQLGEFLLLLDGTVYATCT